MRALLASPLGLLVGLSLGALGAGGSILAVPALVHGLGQPPATATATSLIVVGVAALAGLPSHWRAGRVRLGPGLLFGSVGLGGSALGSALSRQADPDVLLLAFSGVMVAAAAAMWRREDSALSPAAPAKISLPPRSAPQGGASVAVTCGPPPVRVRLDVATATRVVAAGTGVGLLTGSFGVGGGFVIVPALVLLLGFPMPEAVGTSLVVIVINAAFALFLRSGTIDVHWGEVLPFLIMAGMGCLLGRRAGSLLRAATLSRCFAAVLLVVAAATAASSLAALSLI